MSFNEFLCSLDPESVYGFGGLVGFFLSYFIFSLIYYFTCFRRLSKLERFVFDKSHFHDEKESK